MKVIGYILFSIMYSLGRIFPLYADRYFCVMTHDGGSESSVGTVVKSIKEIKPDSKFYYVRKSDRASLSLIKLIFVKSLEMARAQTIFMDNEFLPLAYVRLRKGVKVLQLWHGTGTLKKIGHDINEGRMLKIVKKADSKITHLIVSSDYMGKIYKRAFGVSDDKVYVTGIPRTDILFDEEKRKKDIISFYDEYKELKGKRLILYAPTFRDKEVKNPRLMLDTGEWIRGVPGDTVLLLRLHPHVAKAFDDNMLKGCEEKIVNVSEYADVNTLLLVSSALITDYSSIIFEYILLDRPIYFYAYDLKEFSEDGRGFYEDYESFVPGQVIYGTKELVDAIGGKDTYGEERKRFKERFYKYTDGMSAKRLLDILGVKGYKEY